MVVYTHIGFERFVRKNSKFWIEFWFQSVHTKEENLWLWIHLIWCNIGYKHLNSIIKWFVCQYLEIFTFLIISIGKCYHSILDIFNFKCGEYKYTMDTIIIFYFIVMAETFKKAMEISMELKFNFHWNFHWMFRELWKGRWHQKKDTIQNDIQMVPATHCILEFSRNETSLQSGWFLLWRGHFWLVQSLANPRIHLLQKRSKQPWIECPDSGGMNGEEIGKHSKANTMGSFRILQRMLRFDDWDKVFEFILMYILFVYYINKGNMTRVSSF